MIEVLISIIVLLFLLLCWGFIMFVIETVTSKNEKDLAWKAAQMHLSEASELQNVVTGLQFDKAFLERKLKETLERKSYLEQLYKEKRL